MRTIKFRGKRIDNGEWVYGYYAYLPDVNKIDEPNRDSMPDYKHYILNQYFDIIEVLPETVGQFTGLKDKNGVEIYEGDLVKIPNDYELYGQFAGEAREIFYNEGGFRLKPKWNKNYKGNYLESGIDYEVIGNIHEERSET